jgi:hypothetical protein
LTAIGADYLACGAARRTSTCDNRHSLRRGTIESIILDALKDQLMAPELVAAFIDEFHHGVNRQRQGAELERSATVAELASVTRKLEGLVEAIADGLRPRDCSAGSTISEPAKPRSKRTSAHCRPPRFDCIRTWPSSIARRSPNCTSRLPTQQCTRKRRN